MTTGILPATAESPAEMIQALKHLTPSEIQEAQREAQALDVRDSLTLSTFGISAQKDLGDLTASLLRGTAGKDSGEAADKLTDLMMQVRALNSSSLAAQTESALCRLPGIGPWFSKARQLILRYESVNTRIERIVAALSQSRNTLSADVERLDRLAAENKLYFRRLLTYIAAGELKMDDLRAEHTVAAQAAASSNDPVLAHNAAELGDNIDRLDRRVHDLKLAAMLSLQTAPQLRLIQNGSQALIERIQTSILTTIPLWRIQICIAIALLAQARALKLQALVSDTTDALIIANADKIRTLSNEAQTAAQRGVVGLEALRHANAQLIETIEDSLRIQAEGRQKRQEAEVALEKMRAELQAKLAEVQKPAAQKDGNAVDEITKAQNR